MLLFSDVVNGRLKKQSRGQRYTVVVRGWLPGQLVGGSPVPHLESALIFKARIPHSHGLLKLVSHFGRLVQGVQLADVDDGLEVSKVPSIQQLGGVLTQLLAL